LPAGARFGPITLPLVHPLSELPILGRVYTTVSSGHSLPVYLAWLAVPLTAFVLASTRFGLRLRAVGESLEAVDAAGLSVACLRFAALAVNGALCGVALPGIGTVPVQLIQALPYLITVAILAGFVCTARPPRALGKPIRQLDNRPRSPKCETRPAGLFMVGTMALDYDRTKGGPL
jgi:ABC-type uncharacterized transport system permease subunit